MELEPLHPEVSIVSSGLKDFHGDPADRIIVATAMVCGIPPFTSDPRILDWARATREVDAIAPDASSIE